MKTVMKIETERLILEALKESDYEFIVAIEQTPENKIYEMEGVQEKDEIHERLNMKLEVHMREARLINGKWADEKVFSLIQSDYLVML